MGASYLGIVVIVCVGGAVGVSCQKLHDQHDGIDAMISQTNVAERSQVRHLQELSETYKLHSTSEAEAAMQHKKRHILRHKCDGRMHDTTFCEYMLKNEIRYKESTQQAEMTKMYDSYHRSRGVANMSI